MSDKLKAADVLAGAVREYKMDIGSDAITRALLVGKMMEALAAYEAEPAEQVGDVRILINALKEISLNEDRGNLDGDPAEVALEQCNAMAEEALEAYAKSNFCP